VIHKELTPPTAQNSLAHQPTVEGTEKASPPPKEELPKPSPTMTSPKNFGKPVGPPLTRTRSLSTISSYGKTLQRHFKEASPFALSKTQKD
jgi:hypothetical protein